MTVKHQKLRSADAAPRGRRHLQAAVLLPLHGVRLNGAKLWGYSARVTIGTGSPRAGRSGTRRKGRVGLLGSVTIFACALACSRRSADEGGKTENVPSVAPPSAGPVASAVAAPKPTAAPVVNAPKIPPQLVACGQLEFYRIDQRSLGVFEIAKKQPPPHIRGSRVARQVAKFDLTDPRSVLTWAERQVLVIAKDAVAKYEIGKDALDRYAPIDVERPLWAWTDPKRPGAFSVHAFGESEVRTYTLSRLGSVGAAGAATAVESQVQQRALPELDSRWFTVLADGTPFYSTPGGMRRLGTDASTSALPPPSAALLFPDADPARYWAADANGTVTLHGSSKDATPKLTEHLEGAVIDAAHDGDRVAVLTLSADASSYRPTVTVISHGKVEKRLPIGPTPAWVGQPKLDLCLIPGRPWVVVGGLQWIQLLDWTGPRLLAEW